MKYKSVLDIRNLIACLAIVLPFTLSAQTEETPELQKNIQVYSEYKPQISDASRISVNPKVYDTLDIQVNLKYNVNATPLKTDYHIIPLKAVSVKGDKLQELYKGEFVAGAGNYWTGLLAFRYNTERSRLKQSGVEVYHLGSAGKVKTVSDQKAYAGYSTDYISAYWKRFYENSTFYVSVKPEYKSIYRYGKKELYGYDGPDLDFSTRKGLKDAHRNILGANAKLGIVSNDTDVDALRYNLNMDYDVTYASNPTNLESLIGLQRGLEKKLEKLSLGLTADCQLSALNFTPKDIDSTQTNIQGVASVMPFVKVGANNWVLQAGIKASPVFGGFNTFKILPDVAFSYAIPKLKMIPYFKFNGNVDFNSMNEMLCENPYLGDSIMVKPTINNLGFQIGIDGRVKKLITYNADFSVNAYENMYFWHAYSIRYFEDKRYWNGAVDDEFYTTYKPFYDKTTLMKLHGDLGFLFRKVNVDLDANYYKWQMDSINCAWYKPIVDVTASARFNIINPNSNKTKLTVEPQLYFMMYKNEDLANNCVILDLGFEAKYHYNNILLFFLDVNNILGVNNERYLDYPTQRANFLLGVSFSFAGQKE